MNVQDVIQEVIENEEATVHGKTLSFDKIAKSISRDDILGAMYEALVMRDNGKSFVELVNGAAESEAENILEGA